MKHFAKKSVQIIYGAVAIFLIWGLLHFSIESSVIPSPFETMVYFVKHFKSVLFIHLAMSLLRVLFAVLLALLIGVPAGMLMGGVPVGDALLSPIVYLAYPIPKIAFLPVFMILFGLGDSSKIVLIFSIVVFQIMIGVRDSIKSIPREVHLSARSLGLSKIGHMIHVTVPSMLPALFTSLRMCIGIAISALFLSENYATTYGIGYFIMNNWIMVDYLAMFSGIVGMSLMGLGLFTVIDFLEKKLCRWQL